MASNSLVVREAFRAFGHWYKIIKTNKYKSLMLHTACLYRRTSLGDHMEIGLEQFGSLVDIR